MINITDDRKTEIIEKIKARHLGDESQLNFIFSNEDKVILTAKAGCGKTFSLTSKIVYELAMGNIPLNRRILALTFSVNAAEKISDDTIKILNEFLNEKEIKVVSKNLVTANYHKFATMILMEYGSYILEGLDSLEEYNMYNDNEAKKLLSKSDHEIIDDFNKAIILFDDNMLNKIIDDYNSIVIEKLFPMKILTYNSLLSLAYMMLMKTERSEEIRNYLKRMYKLLIIDEFQDTNLLAKKFLSCIVPEINDGSKIILIGDSQQRIYGFMGAIPHLMENLDDQYKVYDLCKNYRYTDTTKLNDIDIFYRQLKATINGDKSSNKITLNVEVGEKSDEGKNVVDIVKKCMEKGKVAILVKAEWNSTEIIKELESEKIDFFNALFNEGDKNYIEFHNHAKNEFVEKFSDKKLCKPIEIQELLRDIKSYFRGRSEFDSLIKLFSIALNTFDISMSNNYYENVIRVLENKSLKKYIQDIEESILISTVHQSKGLEWDYVVIPAVVKRSFPHSSVCNLCSESKNVDKFYCDFSKIDFDNNLFKDKYFEEMSVFYVALTRAKKEVFISTYYKRDYSGDNFFDRVSCFITNENIELNSILSDE